MENDNALVRLRRRLKRIGIEIELMGNYPWIYLDTVNGNKVKDIFDSEYKFTIAYSPVKPGDTYQLSDISEVFKCIRKYK